MDEEILVKVFGLEKRLLEEWAQALGIELSDYCRNVLNDHIHEMVGIRAATQMKLPKPNA